METLELIKAKREQILRLAAQHGARNVRVFGSFARGDAGPESDVDFLVAMDKGRSYFDLVALWQDLEDLLRRKVDVVTDGGLSPYLKDRILAEATPL
jgi:predicted nucleotidyltransferase